MHLNGAQVGAVDLLPLRAGENRFELRSLQPATALVADRARGGACAGV
jgi:hypothetical protein